MCTQKALTDMYTVQTRTVTEPRMTPTVVAVLMSRPETSARAVPTGPANCGLPGMEPPAVMKPTYGRLIAAAIIMP